MKVGEIWLDIEGFNGFYQVSNTGMVKSLFRRIGSRTHRERILKPSLKKNGYLCVVLQKDKVSKHTSIHRLVAMAFLPKMEDKKDVNHINCIKTDNRSDNLEWCNQSENQSHAYNNGLQGKKFKSDNPMYGRKGSRHPASRPITQKTLLGQVIKTFPSLVEASIETGANQTGISQAASGRYIQSGGFKWSYE